MDLIRPKEFKVEDQDGTERVYILSKFPAVAGREIVAKYPLSAMPKLGDYAVNEQTMFKLMEHVAVMRDSNMMRLSTRALIDNHIPDWETLGKIELAMMEYNCSFFLKEKISTFLDGIVQNVVALITKTLTASSPQSSQTEKPPLPN